MSLICANGVASSAPSCGLDGGISEISWHVFPDEVSTVIELANCWNSIDCVLDYES